HKDLELRELIDKALKRSALKARELAWKTGTPLVIELDGKVQRVSVSEQDVRAYREEVKDSLRL
ncbi:MAG: hypothetical protein V3571_07540, partial [Pseudodesulfovibrio sp.]